MANALNGDTTNLFVPGGMHDFTLWEMTCGEDGDGTDLEYHRDPEGSGFIPIEALAEDDHSLYENPSDESWDDLAADDFLEDEPGDEEDYMPKCHSSDVGVVEMYDETTAIECAPKLVPNAKDRFHPLETWRKETANRWPTRYCSALDKAREKGALCPKGQPAWIFHAPGHNRRKARTTIRRMKAKT